MKSNNSVLTQIRSSLPLIAIILAVSAILLGFALLLHLWTGVPIGMLTRDPTMIGGVPFYTGFLSQMGTFFWFASATICIFSARVLSNHTDNLDMQRFLYASGLLSLILGFDDAFLFHEVLYPHFGLNEMVVFIIYGGFALFYLYRFFSTIVQTKYVLLGMAFICFGISIVVDFLEYMGIHLFLIEDGAKLIGIISWLIYLYSVGIFAIRHHAVKADHL